MASERPDDDLVEHLRRAVVMLDPLCDGGLPFGTEVYAKAHDARTEIRDALAGIGSDPFWDDGDKS